MTRATHPLSSLRLFVVSLLMGLTAPAVVRAQPEGHWELDPARSSFKDSAGDNPIMWDNKEVGRYFWSFKGGVHTYRVKVNHTNNQTTDWQATWTFTGLPPDQLRPGDKIRIAATGSAAGHVWEGSADDTLLARGEKSGLDGDTHGTAGVIGWTRTTTPSSLLTADKWVLEGTVPTEGRRGITIDVYSHATNMAGAMHNLLYVYKWAPGPAKPTATPKPPDKPAVKPPTADPAGRPPLQMRVTLLTPKWAPGEPLGGLIVVSTGLKEGETAAATMKASICQDMTGSDLLWLFAGRGAGKLPPRTTAGAEMWSAQGPTTLGGSINTYRCPTDVEARAPKQPGEYCLNVTLTTGDGRKAFASAPFDVLEDARRLLVGGIAAQNVPAGAPCEISLTFAAGNTEKPGAPVARAKASGNVQAVGKGAGAPFAQELPELVPALQPMGNEGYMQGSARWHVTFPRPGVYRASCQVAVPFYGAGERVATIIVTDRGTEAGGIDNLIAGALTSQVAAVGPTGGRGGATPAGGAPAAGGAETTAAVGGVTAPVEAPANGDATPATDPGAGNATNGAISLPGAGMGIAIRNGTVTITLVEDGSRAGAAGIQPGYQLLEIGGKSTKGMKLAEIAQRLSPADGANPITLTLADALGNNLHVQLVTAPK